MYKNKEVRDFAMYYIKIKISNLEEKYKYTYGVMVH